MATGPLILLHYSENVQLHYLLASQQATSELADFGCFVMLGTHAGCRAIKRYSHMTLSTALT